MERMQHGEGQLIPTGQMQEINPTRQINARAASDADYDYHLKAQTHYWIVIVSHKANTSVLDSHDGVSTGLPILDADTMLGPPATACYICEAGYEPRLRRRKCPGEPR